MTARLLILCALLAWDLTGRPSALGAEPASGGREPVRAAIGGGVARLANEWIRLETRLDGERLEGETLRNLRAGTRLELRGEDFSLELSGGQRIPAGELRVSGASIERGEDGAKRIAVVLEGGGLRVRRVTELREGRWWVERRLEIRSREERGGSPPVPLRLRRLSLGDWEETEAEGPAEPGAVVSTLGYPSGCGQAVYSRHCFLALAHPAAESLARDGRISFALPVERDLPDSAEEKPFVTPPLLLGAGERGAARRAFLGAIDATRPVPARMVILVNDWYWREKDRPLAALEELARLKLRSGVPIDSFTLDDGWDLDWVGREDEPFRKPGDGSGGALRPDAEIGIWGRLNRERFPGGWEALREAGAMAEIGISLWYGPIGGYGGRDRRVARGRELGFETNGDKLCLAGPRYRAHAVESFQRWARLGMDYIKVDGFWPDCPSSEHGHPPAPAGSAEQMNVLMETFAAWREARPDLVIGYTSGSSPSPFWLQHADYVWRGGLDDSHAGAGDPFDRHNTYLDACLQAHRRTDMPVSAFVVFDIVKDRVVGSSEEAFERGAWWLAARTSLHHDWYLEAADLSDAQWDVLKRAALWARSHERVFRWSRMVGGDPGKGEVYGFAAWDAGAGVLALRNPAPAAARLEGTLCDLLDLPHADRSAALELRGVFGGTGPAEGARAASDPFRIDLPGLSVAIWEVRRAS